VNKIVVRIKKKPDQLAVDRERIAVLRSTKTRSTRYGQNLELSYVKPGGIQSNHWRLEIYLKSRTKARTKKNLQKDNINKDGRYRRNLKLIKTLKVG